MLRKAHEEFTAGVVVHHRLPVDRFCADGFGMSVESGKLLVARSNCQYRKVGHVVERLQVHDFGAVPEHHMGILVQIETT